MPISCASTGCPVDRRLLAWSTLALGILCLVIPAFAGAQDSGASLPSAPSAKVPVAAPQTVDHALTFGERARLYERSVFNPVTIIGPAFGAAVGQADDEPPGWGQGAEGYGRRVGSGIGRNVISKTITFGFASIDGEDPRYFRSENRSFWGRTRHAIASTFVAQTASGHQIPAFSRFAGAYGAAFIANTWYPANRATARYAAERGSTSLASSIGLHLLSEFVPHFSKIAGN